MLTLNIPEKCSKNFNLFFIHHHIIISFYPYVYWPFYPLICVYLLLSSSISQSNSISRILGSLTVLINSVW